MRARSRGESKRRSAPPISSTSSGGVYRLLTNFTQAEREYRALQLEVNRALRATGSCVRANYTLSRIDGNSVGSTGGGDDFLEAMTVLDPVAGVPVTAVNRYGRLDHDRTHILNLAGAKRWTLGDPQRRARRVARVPQRRALGIAGIRRAALLGDQRDDPGHPLLRGPRPHQLPDTYALDLTAALGVSDRAADVRQRTGRAGERHRRAGADRGEPRDRRADPGAQSYQTPRELRFVLGVRF